MYTRSVKGWAKHFDFIFLDSLCLILAYFAAYFIRHGFTSPFKNLIYRELFLVLLLLNFMIILFLDTMKDVLKRGYWREMVHTIWQGLLLLLCINSYMFTTKTADDYSRIVIFVMILIYLIITYIVRILWKNHVRRSLKNSSSNALLIVAGSDNAEDLIREVENNNYGRHKIVGVVMKDSLEAAGTVLDVPVVTTYANIIDYVTRNWVDEVLISVDPGESLPQSLFNELTLMGVTVHINLERSATQVGVKQVITNIGGLLVISTSMNYMSRRQYVAKRLMDIFAGIAGCIATGILYLFLAPAIKRESPGPAFFSQERIGRNGKPFKIYKFRSMYMDAEERKKDLLSQNRVKDGMMFKMEFDPRIIGNKIDEKGNRKTGVGEFIRKYSLDEFPQFFNVLKGDMSLVGTRPPLKDEYAIYSSHHKARLATRPGITGLWQVSGRSNIMDFEEVVQLDTQYINNWSIGLDMRIIFKTVKVVLKHEGSM